MRILEERISLSKQIARRAGERGNHSVVQRFDEQNRDAREKAETIRRVLLGDEQTQAISSMQSSEFFDVPIDDEEQAEVGLGQDDRES